MQLSGEPFPYQLCLLGSFLALPGLPAAASKLPLFQGTVILLGYYLHFFFFLQTFGQNLSELNILHQICY